MDLETGVRARLPEIRQKWSISSREAETLCWLVCGVENAAIADHMCVAEKTVKAYLTKVYLKMGVQNRTQAVLKLVELM